MSSRLLVAEQNRRKTEWLPSHFLPPARGPAGPTAGRFPGDSGPSRPRIGPGGSFLALPGRAAAFVVVRVGPPAEAATVNTADALDRRWLTPIALDLRGRNAGREANGLDLR